MSATQLMNRPNFSASDAADSTLRAARHLIQHLADGGAVLGLRPDRNAAPKELTNTEGNLGHKLVVKAPTLGFSDASKERINGYGEAVAVWHNVMCEVEWKDEYASVSFLRPDILETRELPPFRIRFSKWVSDLFQPKSYKALRDLGQMFVDNGFLVREPFNARLIMLDHEFRGNAIVLRYPYATEHDKAGIKKTYDKLLPLIADAVALERNLKSEVHRLEDSTTIFFTKNRQYVSNLYTTKPMFRLVAMRPKVWTPAGLSLFQGSTYRVCKKLLSHYKKDFISTKKPVPALGKLGHSVALNYKPGAGGKVVDDSYVLTVGRMAENLSHSHRLQSSIVHDDDSKVIVVTFYTRREADWSQGAVYGR